MGFIEFVKETLGVNEAQQRFESAMAENMKLHQQVSAAVMQAEAARESLEREAADRREYERRALDAERELAKRSAPKAPTPAPAVVDLLCTCDSASWRLDLLTASVAIVEGALVRRETGALLSCSHCGARIGLDADGAYTPHRKAWPSSWVVDEEISRRAAERTATGIANVRRRNSAHGDVRLPPA